MASPGADASVPNAQQHHAVPAREKEPRSEPNGHVPVDEPTTKPSPQSAVESRSKTAATEEKSALPPTESPKVEAEKPLVNGNGTASNHAESSSAAIDVVKAEEAAPEDKVKPKSPALKAMEEPKAKDKVEETATTAADVKESGSQHVQAKDEPKANTEETATTAADLEEPGSQDAQVNTESSGEPAETSGDAAAMQQSDDVSMTDPAPETRTKSAEPARPSADEKPSTRSAQSVDAAPDTEMTDTPAEDPPSAGKPTNIDGAVLTVGDTATLATSELDLGPASMSQLAIETNEDKSSPVGASADVPMTDAPSAKVARERDDDAAEEPAPKRARTEPMDDVPVEPVPPALPVETLTGVAVAEPEVPGLDATVLTKLSKWNDSETCARTISPYQRREIRKIIGRLRKTKSGNNFRDSVQKLWPALWDGYMQRIEKPMDLGEIDRSLRNPSSPVVTFGHLKTDLALIFENSLSYNGSTHDLTAAAAHVVRTVWEEALPIPAEEPARPKAVPKPKPVRESRAVANAEAAARRQSAGPTASPSADAPATDPSAAAEPATAHDATAAANAATATAVTSAPTQEQSADRRSSTATDGDRPKRTVRAPKSKDIDYTTKPSRKKLKPELQFCDEVLTELMHTKNEHINMWFMDPVDAEGLNIPTYYAQIKKPMDLGKVQRLLSGGDISSLKDFDKTVRLIFDNCYKFNGQPSEGNPVSLLGKQLEDLYAAQMKNKDAWMSKHAAKASAPAASASNASDEDEDEDDGDDAAYAVVDSKEIEELQAKLEEETKKLNGMLLGGNQSLIDIQKGIVDMVQNALIKAAQHTQQSRSKNDKSSKKSAKGGKPKASGGSGGRKSAAGVTQPKKSGGSKKAASKKTLTAAEKDQIASAINDLDPPHLERAIELIKKDTGQNENNDGELELDIDQLSNDALLKLWDLCKKALPGFGKDSAAASNPSPEVNKGAAAKQAPKSAAKPKKNKPMSAQEQDRRIAELTAISHLFGQEQTKAVAESSDDDDSDSEEE